MRAGQLVLFSPRGADDVVELHLKQLTRHPIDPPL